MQRRRESEFQSGIMQSMWILVCSTGCLIQICYLIKQYMKYDMSTSVEFVFPDQIILPIITIRTVLLTMIDWRNERLRAACKMITGIGGCEHLSSTELDHRLSQKYYKQLWPPSEKVIKLFTRPDILSNMTLPLDDLINWHRRYPAGDYYNKGMEKFYNISDSFDVNVYLDRIFICHQMTWKPDLRIRNYYRLNRQWKEYARFYLNTQTAARVKIMYLSYNVGGYERKDEITLTTSPGVYYTSYDHFVSKFLPAPFATNCRDYRSESTGNDSNRLECYYSCLEQMCIQHLGKKPLSSYVTVADNDSLFFDAAFAQQYEQEIHSFSDACDQICWQQDCVQSVFVPRFKSTIGNRTLEDVQFSFYLPSTPYALSESMAKISMESFLTDLLSTFGFWLGLSALDVLKWCAASFSRLLCSKKRKRKERERVLHQRTRRNRNA
jgi:hypothetical protein